MAMSKKKKLLIFGGFIVVLLVFVFANMKKGSGRKITVQSDKVTKGTITSTVSGSARIQPEVQVKISAQVSGQIVDLGVKEGQNVQKGDFLVQLDPEYYQAAKEQSVSNLNYARAGFEKSKNEYERSKKLFADNLISQAELDIAKSTFEQAWAQVEQNEAALKQARDNLAKTTITSPMNGTVSKLNKKVGEMAMGSQLTLDEIMVVADLHKMLAETEIDENDVVGVAVSNTAEIVVDAFPDSVFKGVVKEIANTGLTQGMGTQEQVTNFLVKVSMLDLPKGLRPGMSATVDIMTETREEALKLPIQCITIRQPVEPKEDEQKADKDKADEDKKEASDDESPDMEDAGADSAEVIDEEKTDEEKKPIKVVFVVMDGYANQVPVTTGISSDTEWEILSGLEDGDEVVSGPYRILSKQIKDRDEVKVDNSLKKKFRSEE